MNRRSFVGSLAGGSIGALLGASPRIEAAALQEDLVELSRIGRPAGGGFESGVSRIGYSDEDIAGRRLAMEWMKQAGASIRIDAAGNIFASRRGSQSDLPPLLFGSHIDSVPEGGNFDGCLGALAGIRILRLLEDSNLVTRRPLSAVIWACEEASFAGASLNGSRVAAGKMPMSELEVSSRGFTKAQAIRRIGGDPDRLDRARIRPGDYHAYLELHIEQGSTLARTGIPIGVVDGIVSIDRYDVVVSGAANHAGTTSMADRRDALVGASALVLAVRELVRAEEGSQVGTVGHLDVSPNAANVIPGLVRMTLELRDLSSSKLARIGEKIRAKAAKISSELNVDFRFDRSGHNESALADPSMQRAIEQAAANLGLKTRHLPSGAGHDAQMMATLMPMGMIFVPSIAGISHSPKELTSWQDCANGANVLLGAVLALAA